MQQLPAAKGAGLSIASAFDRSSLQRWAVEGEDFRQNFQVAWARSDWEGVPQLQILRHCHCQESGQTWSFILIGLENPRSQRTAPLQRTFDLRLHRVRDRSLWFQHQQHYESILEEECSSTHRQCLWKYGYCYVDLMAFYSGEEKGIEVWDLAKMAQGRFFPLSTCQDVLCISFTADNRFLISSHPDSTLLIWNIVDC